MLQFKELKQLIEQWAKQRGLDNPEFQHKQFLKLVSEVGELGDAILQEGKGIKGNVEDAIGDTLVALIILCLQKGLDIEKCLELAYDEIKDRTGKMENGVFIKDSDLVNK